MFSHKQVTRLFSVGLMATGYWLCAEPSVTVPISNLTLRAERAVPAQLVTAIAKNNGLTITSANYPDMVTSGNYPNMITSGNYPNMVTSANYPDMVTSGNFPTLSSPHVKAGTDVSTSLPAPKVSL